MYTPTGVSVLISSANVNTSSPPSTSYVSSFLNPKYSASGIGLSAPYSRTAFFTLTVSEAFVTLSLPVPLTIKLRLSFEVFCRTTLISYSPAFAFLSAPSLVNIALAATSLSSSAVIRLLSVTSLYDGSSP